MVVGTSAGVVALYDVAGALLGKLYRMEDENPPEEVAPWLYTPRIPAWVQNVQKLYPTLLAGDAPRDVEDRSGWGGASQGAAERPVRRGGGGVSVVGDGGDTMLDDEVAAVTGGSRESNTFLTAGEEPGDIARGAASHGRVLRSGAGLLSRRPSSGGARVAPTAPEREELVDHWRGKPSLVMGTIPSNASAARGDRVRKVILELLENMHDDDAYYLHRSRRPRPVEDVLRCADKETVNRIHRALRYRAIVRSRAERRWADQQMSIRETLIAHCGAAAVNSTMEQGEAEGVNSGRGSASGRRSGSVASSAAGRHRRSKRHQRLNTTAALTTAVEGYAMQPMPTFLQHDGIGARDAVGQSSDDDDNVLESRVARQVLELRSMGRNLARKRSNRVPLGGEQADGRTVLDFIDDDEDNPLRATGGVDDVVGPDASPRSIEGAISGVNPELVGCDQFAMLLDRSRAAQSILYARGSSSCDPQQSVYDDQRLPQIIKEPLSPSFRRVRQRSGKGSLFSSMRQHSSQASLFAADVQATASADVTFRSASAGSMLVQRSRAAIVPTCSRRTTPQVSGSRSGLSSADFTPMDSGYSADDSAGSHQHFSVSTSEATRRSRSSLGMAGRDGAPQQQQQQQQQQQVLQPLAAIPNLKLLEQHRASTTTGMFPQLTRRSGRQQLHVVQNTLSDISREYGMSMSLATRLYAQQMRKQREMEEGA